MGRHEDEATADERRCEQGSDSHIESFTGPRPGRPAGTGSQRTRREYEAGELDRILAILNDRPELRGTILTLGDCSPQVRVAGECVDRMWPRLAREAFSTQVHAEERFVAMAMDSRMRPIAIEVLTTGTDLHTLVCTRQLFRWALTRQHQCRAIVVAHNHPSGDPTPSEADRLITRRIVDAGNAVGVEVIDHLVVAGRYLFTSMREEMCLPPFDAVAAALI